jgi:uncharacterized protein YdeI (BOF family)
MKKTLAGAACGASMFVLAFLSTTPAFAQDQSSTQDQAAEQDQSAGQVQSADQDAAPATVTRA